MSLKPFPFLILLGLLAGSAHAQGVELFAPGVREAVRVSVSTVYQRLEDDGRLVEEVSVPLSLYVPFGANAGLSLLAGGAVVGGEAVSELSGLADAQVGLHLAREIGRGTVAASLGANLPSGKRELTAEEFATSLLLSRKQYDFRLPALGQGFGFSPGLTVAYPLGETAAIGVGASYTYRGSYVPVSALEAAYDPGDEIVVTGGVDYRVGQGGAISGDLSLAFYGSDALDDETVYEAGRKTTATLQYLRYMGYDELRLVARYSMRGEGRVPEATGTFVPEAQQAAPDYGLVRIAFRKRTGPSRFLGVLVQGRLYGETAAYAAQRLVDVGLLPELRLSSRATFRPRFVFTAGSFTGVEFGAGLSAGL